MTSKAIKPTFNRLRTEQHWLETLRRQKLTENLVSLMKYSTIEQSKNDTASLEKP